MVIDAKRMFACTHEYVAFPHVLRCHKCNHKREELPIASRFQLHFFPVPVLDVEPLTASQ